MSYRNTINFCHTFTWNQISPTWTKRPQLIKFVVLELLISYLFLGVGVTGFTTTNTELFNQIITISLHLKPKTVWIYCPSYSYQYGSVSVSPVGFNIRKQLMSLLCLQRSIGQLEKLWPQRPQVSNWRVWHTIGPNHGAVKRKPARMGIE